jgi:hypothetical protein
VLADGRAVDVELFGELTGTRTRLVGPDKFVYLGGLEQGDGVVLGGGGAALGCC